MTAPITPGRLAEIRVLAAEDHPTGTTAQVLVAAIRDLGNELDRMRAAMRAAPSTEATAAAPQRLGVRSGRTVCAFHQVELGENNSCTGCEADAKALRDPLDTTPPPDTPSRPTWRHGAPKASKRTAPMPPDSTVNAYAAARTALDALAPEDVEAALVAACAELGQHTGAQAIAIRAAEIASRTRPLADVTGA